MVSTNPPSPFTIDLYRLGYYGGRAAGMSAGSGPFDGTVQPEPPVGPERLRECRWERMARLDIPSDWPSGVYLGKLTEPREGLQSYVIFIVRDDGRAISSSSAATRPGAAYNRWPDHFVALRRRHPTARLVHRPGRAR